MVLANAVNSRDSLQLDGCIYQRLAKENVGRVDEIEAGRVCFCMQEEDFFLLSDVSYGILRPCLIMESGKDQ